MTSRNWDEVGERIRNIVQEAIDHQNYEKLSQTIGQAVDEAVKTMKKGTQSFGGRMHYTNQKESPVTAVRDEIQIPSGIGAILGAFFGITAGCNLLLGALACFVGMLFSAGDLTLAVAMIISLVITGGLGGAAMALGVKSVKKLQRISRLKKYKKVIGKKEYCNISLLAAEVRKPDALVVKDLEYMIKNRWFPQGYLDRGKTCLMLTNQMYQQYLQLEKQKQAEIEENRKTVEPQQKEDLPQQEKNSSEVAEIIAKGEKYLARIRACNDAIPGKEISDKILRIEILVDKIFERVEQEPKSVTDIRRLMEYYLPTTVKLLEAYAKMDAQPVGGENIQTSKKEIEETLDTLNVAFEKLLDSLFQDTAWDISSDISVLNTMLAQEGLTDDGIHKK